MIFSPEFTDLWNRWERSSSISGAPNNEDTIQLWSFGFLQIARAILLNYFAKTTLGEQFWTAMETAEDSHSLKGLAAWIVETHLAEDDVEEASSPSRRRNTNSYEFKSTETPLAEPSVWSFLDPLDEVPDVRMKSSDSVMLDADCQVSYYQKHRQRHLVHTGGRDNYLSDVCTTSRQHVSGCQSGLRYGSAVPEMRSREESHSRLGTSPSLWQSGTSHHEDGVRLSSPKEGIVR